MSCTLTGTTCLKSIGGRRTPGGHSEGAEGSAVGGLARKAGFSERTVYRILSCKVNKPTKETWRNLRVAVKQMCCGN